MTVTFFGHSSFVGTPEHESRILKFLSEKIGDKTASIYLGDKGGFDSFAYTCCDKYRQSHKNTSLIYVTPYITPSYQKKLLCYQKRFDAIIYPQIEDKPIRFAISYRNKFMVDSADYVVTYVSHSYGGAYKAYKYAHTKRKSVFNLADYDK